MGTNTPGFWEASSSRGRSISPWVSYWAAYPRLVGRTQPTMETRGDGHPPVSVVSRKCGGWLPEAGGYGQISLFLSYNQKLSERVRSLPTVYVIQISISKLLSKIHGKFVFRDGGSWATNQPISYLDSCHSYSILFNSESRFSPLSFLNSTSLNGEVARPLLLLFFLL